MYYVIIRLSYDRDIPSVYVRNRVAAVLKDVDGGSFTNTMSGTWEKRVKKASDALAAVTEVSGVLKRACTSNPSILDHLWIMVDKQDKEGRKKPGAKKQVAKKRRA
ncbi:MAG: hypothetical protein J0I17_11145 ['Candidatus Kapabacteria' thiocyanatum]|uniref:Uncharacterized protein n=1 Tax=Candidatus Kapaibacterium thiocyanatum TaxID=1895771 RepID=A0A1M3KYV5_9BACT|nr:hypothetical protein ['Candidatus Kapabacteria' thiocyanatum]OJX57692.1 MAG: hypothetical protein BGO89_06890 ['Candidatus Kapabacteria' thiocyanatum]